jgi:hypothetical protein
LFYGGDESPPFRYGTSEAEGSAKIPPTLCRCHQDEKMALAKAGQKEKQVGADPSVATLLQDDSK